MIYPHECRQPTGGMSFYRWPPITAERITPIVDTNYTMIQVAPGAHTPYMSIAVNPQLMDTFYSRAADLWTNVMHTLWHAQCAPAAPNPVNTVHKKQ